MATVYLATDLRHERNVALKVLKPELAAVVGADRFLAEIKTTANLQHPHILPLFDSGAADGFLFYVMPRVEGESLRERLDQDHQLSVDEAVRIASAVAQALDYAHRHGVVHRDIKPANILMHDGQPVISDFGIALAVSAGGAGRLTETGLSLGTPHYMSPEQATGELSVGPPTDVWALGCVLYEMLTGEPPYTGGTPQSVLGKIITEPAPSARKQRKTVPPNVDAVVRRALEKVPADRFASGDAFVRALTEAGFSHGEEKEVVGAGPWHRWRRLAVATGVSTVVLALALVWLLTAEPPSRPVRRYTITLASDLVLPTNGRVMDVSRDGSAIVLAASLPGMPPQLWLRPLGQLEAVPIPGTEGAGAPHFSPDGASIAFRLGASLRTASLGGAPPQTLMDGLPPSDLTWSDDGFIYFTNAESGLSRIPAGGGEVEVVTTLQGGEVNHNVPSTLPEGRALLFTTNDETGTRRIAVATARPSTQHSVLFEGRTPTYVDTGHIVFGTVDGKLLAVPFDPDRLEVIGPVREVVPSVWTPTAGGLVSRYAVSDDGLLVYVPGGVVEQQLVWVDRGGAARELDAALPRRAYVTANVGGVALAPDDERLAVSFQGPSGDLDLHLMVLGERTFPLAQDVGNDFRPVWFPLGDTIAYISATADGNPEVRKVPADGSWEGRSEVVLERDAGVFEVQVSRVRGMMYFREGVTNLGRGDIGLFDRQNQIARERLFASDFHEKGLALSPDERWIAYVSNRSGQDEVYVRPADPSEGVPQPVSRADGVEPLWGRNGRELYYREPSTGYLISVTYTAGETFDVESREQLFDASGYATNGDGAWRSYDASIDGQRFLMIRMGVEAEAGAQAVVVENWFEELRRLAPN